MKLPFKPSNRASNTCRGVHGCTKIEKQVEEWNVHGECCNVRHAAQGSVISVKCQ